MAKANRIISGMNGTPGFRETISFFKATIEAAGWVQTTDTGQLDPATILYQGSGVITGYLIYRMNDSLQATVPVFAKFEFGTTAGNSPYVPVIFITIGTGSNGAGSISGLVSGRYSNFNNGCTGTFSQGDVRIYGTSSSIYCSIKSTASSYTSYFFIDRLRDQQGVPTSGGVILCTSVNGDNAISSVPVFDILYFPTNVRKTLASSATSFLAFYPDTNVGLHQGSIDSNIMGVLPTVYAGKPYTFPLLLFKAVDSTEHVEFDMSVFGITHRLLFLPALVNTSAHRFAIFFE